MSDDQKNTPDEFVGECKEGEMNCNRFATSLFLLKSTTFTCNDVRSAIAVRQSRKFKSGKRLVVWWDV